MKRTETVFIWALWRKRGEFKSGHGIPETEMDGNIVTDNVKL